MEVTDFVGNSHSVTFDVEKGTDEFLGYLTGWDDSGSGAEYDTVGDDGKIELADNATSATFAVSFITAIDETTLDAADFAFEYSTSGDDDISGLSITSIASNGSTTAANDYLITASGGNLPLAAGQLTLAFADSPSIEILGGGTYFDLNLIRDENQSFAYGKDFNFSIDSVAQLNPSAVGEVPELEINFVAPDTGGSSSLTIEGYKLYYALDSAVTLIPAPPTSPALSILASALAPMARKHSLITACRSLPIPSWASAAKNIASASSPSTASMAIKAASTRLISTVVAPRL